jgi:hypothetical protein
MSDDTVWKPSYHEETTDVREPRHLAEKEVGHFGGDTPTVETTELTVRDAGEVDLFEDPFDDDLNARLVAAGPRRLANRYTLVFAALAIAVVGFIAGAQTQKSYGTSSASTGTNRGAFPTALPSGFAFNRGGGGLGGGANGGTGTGTGGARGGVTGTVKLVDGTTVYVEGQDDNGTVTATSITKTK